MKKLTLYLAPIVIYLLGGMCNYAVEYVNAGRMPVVIPQAWSRTYPWNTLEPGDIINDRHSVEKDSDHLKFLDDRIHLPGEMYSIGDVMLYVGDELAFPVLGIAALLELRRKK